MGVLFCFIVMEWLKTLLINTRWGDQVTAQDRFLVKEMTFMEVWKSSFLLPKTARIATSRTIRRR